MISESIVSNSVDKVNEVNEFFISPLLLADDPLTGPTKGGQLGHIVPGPDFPKAPVNLKKRHFSFN